MRAQAINGPIPAPIPAGKLPAPLLARLLAGSLPGDVRVGPAVGEDACVLAVPEGLLVAATDPITFATSDLGRSAVLVNANDVAVCGVRPRWFLAVVLLPLGTTEDAVEALFADVRAALDEVGASLVGGHTEVTSAVNQAVVIGQMLGVAEDGRFVRTGGASPGDVVVQVGAVPVEGAAVLAQAAVEAALTGTPAGGLPPDLPSDVLAAARRGLHDPGISVVDVALAAAAAGASALHDPTEGGLAAGLHEMALAAGVAIRVDRSEVRWFEPGLEVCRALGADPWATLASGSLLAAFPPAALPGARAALAGCGRPVAAIGVVEAGDGVRDTDGTPVPWPDRDEVARVLGA